MRVNRNIATSLTIGAFLLMAVTGILMFFHLDQGLNKLAHEWLGWAMVAGVALHVTANFPAFRRYFGLPVGRTLIAAFALLLGLSFVPAQGAGGKPPFAPLVDGLSSLPLSSLAAITGEEHLKQILQDAGLSVDSARQSLRDLVGDDGRRQLQILSQLLGPVQVK